MSPKTIQTCQHFKEDGVRCGAIAMRRQRYCLNHLRERRLEARMKAEHRRLRWFESLRLDDFKTINVALIKIMHGMLEGHIESKLAGQTVFKLALAASALRKAEPQPAAPNDGTGAYRLELPGIVHPRRR